MPRGNAKPDEVDEEADDLAHLDADVRDLAVEKHALNVLIREYDWQRAQDAAVADGVDSVSEVVRTALTEYLDRHPQADLFREFAPDALRAELARRQRQRKLTKK